MTQADPPAKMETVTGSDEAGGDGGGGGGGGDGEAASPLDLSHRQTGSGGKRRRVSGVTLFPGLTITPGRGDDAPPTPSPTPSPPHTAFPRFHFSRAQAPVPPQQVAKPPLAPVPAPDASPPPPGHTRTLPRPQEGESGDADPWWYPGLVGADLFPGLPDLPLPFPGLPAFRECNSNFTVRSFLVSTQITHFRIDHYIFIIFFSQFHNRNHTLNVFITATITLTQFTYNTQ